ncbi:MAG: hypothetical protein HQL43_04250 [Alphaproteobacteria bacterium]|nr:hypothetical protein [Alphaproteobacteria bacterium]
MKKRNGKISLRLPDEEKASLREFASEHNGGNLSTALRAMIRAVCCNSPILLFMRQIRLLVVQINRLCHFLREQSSSSSKDDLLPIVERLEAAIMALQGLASAGDRRAE